MASYTPDHDNRCPLLVNHNEGKTVTDLTTEDTTMKHINFHGIMAWMTKSTYLELGGTAERWQQLHGDDTEGYVST